MRRPPSILPSLGLAALAALVALTPSPAAAQTLTDPGWTQAFVLPINTLGAAVPDPVSGAVYWGLFPGGSYSTGDVFMRAPDGRTRLVADANDQIGGLVAPGDGTLYYTKIVSGHLERVVIATGAITRLVSDWHAGDDDPVGMTLVPDYYQGALAVAPGELVLVDVGTGTNPDYENIYAIDPANPSAFRALHVDDNTLQEPTDVAFTRDLLVVSDFQSPNLWYVTDTGGIAALPFSSGDAGYAVSVEYDPATDSLITAHLDDTLRRVVQNPDGTFTATIIGTGFPFGTTDYQAVGIRPDGGRMVISTTNALYVYDRCDVAAYPNVADCDGSGVNDLCELRTGASADCNVDGLPDACNIAAATDTDCDADGIPDTCPACDTVDVVFVMDTSASMDDDAAVLCARIGELASAFAYRGITVNATFYGISNNPGGAYSCLQGNVIAALGTGVPGDPPPELAVLGACPGGNEVASEDWARATAVIAGRFPWTPGAARLIVPIADEGPWCGDPVTDPGVDRDSVTYAAQVARDYDVLVSPIMASGSSAAVIRMGTALADGTGGTVVSSGGAAGLVDEIIEVVRRGCFVGRDCNGNGRPDACDITESASADCDGNGVPDECDVLVPGTDCDDNGVPDACDIAAGAADCDGNGVPDHCADCDGGVDVLFVMDTSSSMDDDASALCTAAVAIGDDLHRRGVQVTTTFLGISANPGGAYKCLTSNVIAAYGAALPGTPPDGLTALGQCPGGLEVASEDWGRALAVAAHNHPWRTGATRLLVPIVDEGPWCGDPVTAIDVTSAAYGAQIAAAAGVIVSPIITSGAIPEVVAQAQAVADATGGQLFTPVNASVLPSTVVASVLDACDTTGDCDGDDVPDSCQIADGSGSDCDGNGVLDLCDVVRGAGDCDGNGRPDSCDLAAEPERDCDGDGVLDSCALEAGEATDCDGDGVPDVCAVAEGSATDADADGIPDACQQDDCDDDGIDDALAVATGAAPDCNGNGRPDACDVAGPWVVDATWELAAYDVVAEGDDNGVSGLLGYERAGALTAQTSALSGALGTPLAGPYAPDFRRSEPTLALTEVLVDAPGAGEHGGEWVELYNAGGATVALDGWALVVDGGAPLALPAVNLGAGAFVVLTGAPEAFAADWGLEEALIGARVLEVPLGALADGGGTVELVSPDGGVAWSVTWTGDQADGEALALAPALVITPASGDCDGGGVPDECQADCDESGVADVCELLAGARDCDEDGVLDVCQPDCDDDGEIDVCAITAGAADCDGSGVPDSCELLAGAPDCDDDGVLDSCQADCDDDGLIDACAVAEGAADCDESGVPDSCELAAGAPDCDANGVLDTCQADCDDDGEIDACAIAAGAVDCDGSGVPDSCELADGAPDCDADGVLDACQADCDDDGVIDVCAIAGGTVDCDESGVPDSCELAAGAPDCDDDGVLDTCQPDCDGDGLIDACAIAAGAVDCDGSGVPDSCELAAGAADCDANGVLDTCQADCDDDGVIDVCAITAGAVDCDGSGVPDSCELAAGAPDCDADGVLDSCQADCDDDGLIDACAVAGGALDCDGSGVPDSCELAAGAPDCDDDGVMDVCALATGAPDCDDNGVPDSCDLAGGAPDCDANGVPDRCDLAGGAPDCDDNGVPDSCDLATGAPDCDDNGVPDRCDLAGGAPDCDDNGVPDRCDLAGGAPDCDDNGVPDRCDLAGGAADCDDNGVPDVCDLAGGAPDCDDNGVPDRCDLAAGAADCDDNGVLDVCDLAGGAPDCDANGVPDRCDLAGGAPDCDDNGVPDRCDLAGGAPDCDANGVPDRCEPDCDGDGVPDACDDPIAELCNGLDDDCDGLTDADDPDLVLDACPEPGCETTVRTPDLCVDGAWRPCTCEPDQDGDGIPDAADNCPGEPNAGQTDRDGNGIGDACEVERTLLEGGGCGTGGDPRGGGALVLLLAGCFMLARRRATRRRA